MCFGAQTLLLSLVSLDAHVLGFCVVVFFFACVCRCVCMMKESSYNCHNRTAEGGMGAAMCEGSSCESGN